MLSDAVVTLRAPTQVWSGRDGDLGAAGIHGVYHGDIRQVRELTLTCDGREPEWISTSMDGPSRVVFGGLLRALDDPSPDPRVRLLRERVVADGAVGETLTIVSRVAHPDRGDTPDAPRSGLRADARGQGGHRRTAIVGRDRERWA